MATMERPGVDPVWAKSWKRDCKNLTKWWNVYHAGRVERLEHYSRTGEDLDPSPFPVPAGEFKKKWSIGLWAELAFKACLDVFEIERQGMSGAPFNVDVAVRAFAAMYTQEMIFINKHHSTAARGWFLQKMDPAYIPFTALGVVVGCTEQAFSLTRLQMTALKKQWYDTSRPYPIARLILQVLADYLKELPLAWEAGAANDHYCESLARVWRQPDPAEIVPACLAVCDVHTRLCEVACDTQATEFNNGEFSRTPIEILMIFKLRQRLGLHNPVIDHPLMQSPLGLLPDEVRFESIAAGPDDLIYRVRAKMMEDEYDEEAIVRSVRG